MGVGPGTTEAYWKEIYNYDNLMGGCVWEMVDHAVLHTDGSYTSVSYTHLDVYKRQGGRIWNLLSARTTAIRQ